MAKITKEEEIIQEYMAGDMSYIDAIDELVKTGITALEAERIISDLEPEEEDNNDT